MLSAYTQSRMHLLGFALPTTAPTPPTRSSTSHIDLGARTIVAFLDEIAREGQYWRPVRQASALPGLGARR
jgi:hypothetical protein